MITTEELVLLNKMEIIDIEGIEGPFSYILVKDNPRNQKILIDLLPQYLSYVTDFSYEKTIDISHAAFDWLGVTGYDITDGFSI